MKKSRPQDQQHKFSIFPLQHVSETVERDGQHKIIAHRVEGPKIQSQQHEQGEGQGKIQALVVHGLQEKKGGGRREHAEDQKIIFSAGQRIQNPYQQIEARLRHHIPAHEDFVEGIHIIPVVVPHVDAQRRKAREHHEQEQKDGSVHGAASGHAPSGHPPSGHPLSGRAPSGLVSSGPAVFPCRAAVFCFHQPGGPDRQDADASIKQYSLHSFIPIPFLIRENACPMERPASRDAVSSFSFSFCPPNISARFFRRKRRAMGRAARPYRKR